MKMKSLKAQFIGAIAMVLVAAIAMGSSTYAWFATNNRVTANGMSVTVKSDSTFLLIKQGNETYATVQTAKKTEDTAATASAALFPTAHDAIAAVGDVTAQDDHDTDGDTSDDTMVKWYYKHSTDPTVYGGSGKETAATYLPVADFDKYVLANTFTLTLAAGSNEMSNITVESCTINAAASGTSGDEAVKVLVVGTNGWMEYDGSGTLIGASSSAPLRTANLTSTTTEVVNVYIYWDGADSDVYTNGIADLKSTSVEVVFTGTVVAAS